MELFCWATFRILIFLSKKKYLSLFSFLCFFFPQLSLSTYNHVFDEIQYFLRKKMKLVNHSEYKKNSYCQDFTMFWRFGKYCIVQKFENTSFHWPVFSHTRTEYTIQPLYERIRVNEIPCSCKFYAVFIPA